jgi:hypothetical protein
VGRHVTSKRSLLRILERERESYAAERQRLIDTICHLAGRPWNVPPADMHDFDAVEKLAEEPRFVYPEHWSE